MINLQTTAILDSITDIHIKTRLSKSEPEKLEIDFDQTLIFPGPEKAPEFVRDIAIQLFQKAINASCEFMVEVDQTFWRGLRDEQAIDGTWFRMRKSLKQAPTLKSTPSPFPTPYQKALLDAKLNRGGIILVSGGAGCGKTTTASAILVSRLTQHGGVAFTVEDPPEHPLSGWHGAGYCWQTSVVGSGKDSDWTRSMQLILRSQPVGTNQILFVGEIRTSEAAQMMVRAANNGFLVITTSFGSSLPSALESFCTLVGNENIQAFASMIRIVIYQMIMGDRFSVDFLIASDDPNSKDSSSKVAQLIKSKQFAQLKDELIFQRNQLAMAVN